MLLTVIFEEHEMIGILPNIHNNFRTFSVHLPDLPTMQLRNKAKPNFPLASLHFQGRPKAKKQINKFKTLGRKGNTQSTGIAVGDQWGFDCVLQMSNMDLEGPSLFGHNIREKLYLQYGKCLEF